MEIPSNSEFFLPFTFLQINNSGKWSVHPDAIHILQNIGSRLLKIVCISGPMRKGKSFLMNRLANQQSGFDVGSLCSGCTKGIWGWFIRGDSEYLEGIVDEKDYDILLLDTEGMYDTDRRDTLIDSQLFVAGILLSSLLIYNTTTVIDEHAIDQLSFVTQLSVLISAKQGNKPIDNIQTFQYLFPGLLWVVRDFHLDLSPHNNSATTYLNHCLKPLQNDYTNETAKKNMTRDAISRMFPSLQATTIAHPGVDPQDMQRINKLPYSSLSPQFRRDCDNAVRMILSSVRPKLIKNPSSPTECNASINVTPESLLAYGQSICESFNNDGIPRLDDMFTSVSTKACAEAIQRAKSICISKFEEVLDNFSSINDLPIDDDLTMHLPQFKYPCDDIQLNEIIGRVQIEVIKQFTSLALGPLLKSSQEELENWLKLEVENFREKNYNLSKILSNEVISTLFKNLEHQSETIIESFEQFDQVQEKTIETYKKVSVLGPASDDVIFEYFEKFEHLRDKMRLRFQLSEAQKQVDIAEMKLTEEMAQAAQQQKQANEELQRVKEESELQQQFFH